MHILKSSIALVLLLSACEALPIGGAQPLLTSSAPAPIANSALTSSSQSLSTIETNPDRQPQPRSAAEVAFMKAQLNAIQPRSIAEDREYCGYLGRLPNGDFAISGPKRGQPAGCTPNNPPANMRVIASYHTHAAYAPRYDSEVPSSTDLEGDITEGINGYVSTPGGRLWFTDGAAQSTTQICGIGCLAADPRFRPEPNPVKQSYSLAALRQRQN
ncbi:MAG: DUF4329 domain-containing protein [Rhodobacteraceae bacterium]|nr:DUF4329 domain-containing protein [Paracoccaceae bacterium]